MERLAQKQYKLKVSKDKLCRLGFRYNKGLEGYSRTVEVYKYKNTVPMIYCRINVDEEDNRVWLIVCDDNDRLYAPYYNSEFGKNTIVDDIEKNISKELNRLGILKVNLNQ